VAFFANAALRGKKPALGEAGHSAHAGRVGCL
jgi:hypothetical protein